MHEDNGRALGAHLFDAMQRSWRGIRVPLTEVVRFVLRKCSDLEGG